jgi:hypothetical protein
LGFSHDGVVVSALDVAQGLLTWCDDVSGSSGFIRISAIDGAEIINTSTPRLVVSFGSGHVGFEPTFFVVPQDGTILPRTGYESTGANPIGPLEELNAGLAVIQRACAEDKVASGFERALA